MNYTLYYQLYLIMYHIHPNEKSIRDPIHNWIHVSKEEMDLINSPLVQRLRHVGQLSSVDSIYPGGNNTRFSHSLGAMYLAGKYAQHLWPNNEKNIQLARLAGLLHDVGHGPFSHVYDHVIYNKIYNTETQKKHEWIKTQGHDQHRLVLIQSKLLKPLIESCGITISDLIKVWTTKGHIINLIVQGPIGADRMDFILRDSYYTGTQHLGTIAYERIISNSLIINGKLHYEKKIIGDIVHALQARFHMYKEVYYHKNSVAATILLELCLTSAAKHINLIFRTLNLQNFVFLNDGLLSEIANSTDPNLKIAKKYAQRYLIRDLPKLKYEKIVKHNKSTKILSERVIDKIEKEVMTTNNVWGMDPKHFDPYIFVYNEKSITFQEFLDQNDYLMTTPKYTIMRVYEM